MIFNLNQKYIILFFLKIKLIKNREIIYLEYIKHNLGEKKINKFIFSINNYPTHLTKKVTLLNYFKSYLISERVSQLKKFFEITILKIQNIENLETNNSNKIVYIQKWLKTKYAMIFRLSNNVIQVIY